MQLQLRNTHATAWLLRLFLAVTVKLAGYFMARAQISNFIVSAGCLLAFTATAKFFSSFGAAGIWSRLDPIFHISFAHLFLASAVLEFVVAGICFFHKNQVVQVGMISIAGGIFLLYRLGIYWMGYHNLCPCLGNLAGVVHISPAFADNIAKLILVYLLAGSYVSLFWLWRQRQKAPASISSL